MTLLSFIIDQKHCRLIIRITVHGVLLHCTLTIDHFTQTTLVSILDFLSLKFSCSNPSTKSTYCCWLMILIGKSRPVKVVRDLLFKTEGTFPKFYFSKPKTSFPSSTKTRSLRKIWNLLLTFGVC